MRSRSAGETFGFSPLVDEVGLADALELVLPLIDEPEVQAGGAALARALWRRGF